MLTNIEIARLVNRYIGVNGGYLGDFSYRSLREFYPDYCGLDLDPEQYAGTTRQRFIEVLHHAPPDQQAAIVRGVLRRSPPESFPEDLLQEKQALAAEFEAVAARLSGGAPVVAASVASSETVARALADAEALLTQRGASSAADRVHTALHAYLVHVCQSAEIPLGSDPSFTSLLTTLRDQHPAFQQVGPAAQEAAKVFRAFGKILDAINQTRNRHSLAHPNAELLDEADAHLIIDAGKTILNYVGRRTAAHTSRVLAPPRGGDGQRGLPMVTRP